MQEQEERHISWSHAIEEVIRDIGEKAQCLSWMHSHAQSVCAARSNYINLPVIVLSTLSGTASIGSNLFEGFGYASVVIGLVSIFVAILQTLNSYFTFSKLAEGHRITAVHYAKLYQFVLVELALPRDERMPPDSLLKAVRETSERLLETSPLLPNITIDAFKLKFKDVKDIAVPPAANGLHKIVIHAPNRTPTLTLPSPVAFTDNPLKSSLTTEQKPQ